MNSLSMSSLEIEIFNKCRRWWRLVALAALMAGAGFVPTALSQGTGISYQGQLTQAGAPAEGSYDLRATLYPALSGGRAIGSTLTLTAVEVHRGGFTVDLDFGAGAFNGQPRWLELAVRPAGGGAFTPLQPRQALNAVPYALYAMTPAGPQGEPGPKGDKGEKGDPGPSRLSDADLFFRGPENNFHGIGWFGESKPFGSESPDGPVLYGLSGGALGSHNPDGTKVALRWTQEGTVAIGPGAKPANAPLHVAAEGMEGDQLIVGSPRLENGDTTLVIGLTAPQGGGSYLQAIAATGQSYGDLLANPDGGRVGIRTRTPTAELEVDGTVKAKRFEGDGSGLTGVSAQLESKGTVRVWSRNEAKEVQPPLGLGDVVAIATRDRHCMALQRNGKVVTWGIDGFGQPTVPANLADVKAIAAGAEHGLALKRDGTVVAWGDNRYGQSTVPPDLAGVKAISTGSFNGMALKQDGTVVVWGGNETGQKNIPVGLKDVVAISMGDGHCLALRSDGTVVAWGYNRYGQGVVPTGLDGVTAIAAALYSNLVLKRDGTIVGWGNGQADRVPTGLSDITAIATADNLGGVVLKRDGSIVSWGALSDAFPALTGVDAIAAGENVVMVLKRAATVPGNLVVSGSVSATAFNTTSDRNAKERFTPVDPQAVLNKVVALPISQWNFKSQPDETHVGPMAQDFHAAFGLGTDDRHIATVDADGVALAAIQGLNRRLEGVSRAVADTENGVHIQIDALRKENAELRDQLARFEALLRPLMNGGKPNGDR